MFNVNFSRDTLDFHHHLIMRDALILTIEKAQNCPAFVILRAYVRSSGSEPIRWSHCIHCQGAYAFSPTRLNDHIINLH